VSQAGHSNTVKFSSRCPLLLNSYCACVST
jgi:hypothetical protein